MLAPPRCASLPKGRAVGFEIQSAVYFSAWIQKPPAPQRVLPNLYSLRSLNFRSPTFLHTPRRRMAWSFRLRKAFVEDISEPPQEEAKRRVQKVGQRNTTGGETFPSQQWTSVGWNILWCHKGHIRKYPYNTSLFKDTLNVFYILLYTVLSSSPLSVRLPSTTYYQFRWG